MPNSGAETVWLSAAVCNRLLAESTLYYPLETGGILLGYRAWQNNKFHWVITSVSGPGVKAKHYRYKFHPDDSFHKQVAIEKFESTNGREYYIGDWHTHPNGSCATSWIDRHTLIKNAKRADHTDYSSLMLIVGDVEDAPVYGAYIGSACPFWKAPYWKPNKALVIFG